MTLAEINDELGAARTNKKEFLEKLEAIKPWETFLELIQPSYYKRELGNKPYPLELMLRIFILQNIYNLSDMAVMNKVIDSRAFSNFCGINSPKEVLNGNTIGRFRNILTRNGLQEKIFKAVVEILIERGLILKKGTIVDSTFIESNLSTKNRKTMACLCSHKKYFSVSKDPIPGLRKQTAKLNIMFALANLYLAARKSLTV